MLLTELAIPGLLHLVPKRHGDHRGFFAEVFKASILEGAGFNDVFIQDNHSMSAEVGTVRGLHFQKPPFAQAKLVRVVRGAIFDVALDLRRNSPTCGQHVSVELSADNGAQLLVPDGFAHGFCTLEPNTEVIYKVTRYYSREAESGVLWSDPDLGIAWPLGPRSAVISDKDATLPRLRDMNFRF
ncbi:MAG: dTDP-4-dehydrorhamnose 3,5-epimerase [Hyphomicrobium sp.]